jgi:hypothetical protein
MGRKGQNTERKPDKVINREKNTDEKQKIQDENKGANQKKRVEAGKYEIETKIRAQEER